MNSISKTGKWVERIAQDPTKVLPSFYSVMRSMEGSISYFVAQDKGKPSTAATTLELREAFQQDVGDFAEPPFCITESEAEDFHKKYPNRELIKASFRQVGTWLKMQADPPSEQDIVDRTYYELEAQCLTR